MKKRLYLIIIISLLLTVSALFINIVPCESWYGTNSELDDNSPHNEFCKINLDNNGPHNVYFYYTTNPFYALILTLVSFLVILFIINLALHILYRKR